MNRRRRSSLDNDQHEGEGRYANYFELSYNKSEFVIDFDQYYSTGEEGSQAPTRIIRIITNPFNAKALLGLLSKSVEDYERNFGVIKARKSGQQANQVDKSAR